MKKLIFISVILLAFSSCASLNNFLSGRPAGSVLVKDYSMQMYLVRSYFPEIYDLYRSGRVTITEVYEYTDKHGTERVGISYRNL